MPNPAGDPRTDAHMRKQGVSTMEYPVTSGGETRERETLVVVELGTRQFDRLRVVLRFPVLAAAQDPLQRDRIAGREILPVVEPEVPHGFIGAVGGQPGPRYVIESEAAGEGMARGSGVRLG